MVNFSNDADILKYEPTLFGELHFAGQILAKGTGGVLSGTTFTASGADFVSALVAAGGVIHLQSADGVLDMGVEVVSVDSATQLTVSVIRDDSENNVIAPPAATAVTYRVSTFRPQASETSNQLTEYFGISPGDPSSGISTADILGTDVLRGMSVFAVLSSIYATLASDSEGDNFWKKSLYYKKLFEKARERSRVSLDIDGDGVADTTRFGGSVNLKRN